MFRKLIIALLTLTTSWFGFAFARTFLGDGYGRYARLDLPVQADWQLRVAVHRGSAEIEVWRDLLQASPRPVRYSYFAGFGFFSGGSARISGGIVHFEIHQIFCPAPVAIALLAA